MANGYSQNFTLKDIFNNDKLKGKIPLVNYVEKEKDGKVSRRTNMLTLLSLISNNSKQSAKPFYKPIRVSREPNRIVIDGKLLADISAPYNAVYNGLVSIKNLMILTVNNMEMVRSALKEGEKSGKSPKLYLRANSMQEIEGMSKQKIYALMDDIMQNIFYNDDFAKTQKKFEVDKIQPKISSKNYEQRKEMWQRKVGML